MGKVTFLEARKVHIDDSFWSPKMELWKRVTIDDVLNKFEGKHVNEPGNHNTLSNFDRVTQGCTGTGGHVGPPWFDGLIYESDPRHCRLPDIISRTRIWKHGLMTTSIALQPHKLQIRMVISTPTLLLTNQEHRGVKTGDF